LRKPKFEYNWLLLTQQKSQKLAEMKQIKMPKLGRVDTIESRNVAQLREPKRGTIERAETWQN